MNSSTKKEGREPCIRPPGEVQFQNRVGIESEINIARQYRPPPERHGASRGFEQEVVNLKLTNGKQILLDITNTLSDEHSNAIWRD
ncbi:hypothetical protein [uncultured Gimesia sp.]|uniref:hypothetical protein n=1 Tax=uncultured Gimesia sp. TaxID=1678688 RepID=UPI0030DB0E77|tara:strand:+ start:35581 stop:35838 length:258 start_codon:yes stop_codon:yes gene_type:complete